MAATKGTKRGAKKGSAKKGSTKKSAAISFPIPGKGPHPLYGMPIDKAIASGDLATMRRLSIQAKSYLKELQAALGKLDSKIRSKG